MASKEYSELLKDPRWQKKRLEIMQRDNFTCQHCGCNDKNLQVHHLHYHKGLMPWEYDNADLITLCESCHRKTHNITSETKRGNIRYNRVVLPSLSDTYMWVKGSKKGRAFLHVGDVRIELSKYNLEEISYLFSEISKKNIIWLEI